MCITETTFETYQKWFLFFMPKMILDLIFLFAFFIHYLCFIYALSIDGFGVYYLSFWVYCLLRGVWGLSFLCFIKKREVARSFLRRITKSEFSLRPDSNCDCVSFEYFGEFRININRSAISCYEKLNSRASPDSSENPYVPGFGT